LKESHFSASINVVRIGDSLAAPNFRLAVRPNSWQKSVKQSATTSATRERDEMYRVFWEAFLAQVRTEHPRWTRGLTSRSAWVGMSQGMPAGVAWNCVAYSTGLIVELTFESRDADLNRRRFQALSRFRDQFDADLDWNFVEDLKKQTVRKVLTEPVDIANQAKWSDYFRWMIDASAALRASVDAIGGITVVDDVVGDALDDDESLPAADAVDQ
jgi:hypothetical protein